MQANVRLAITSTTLGAAVLATFACVGCNNPASDALASALKPLTAKYTIGGSVNGLSGNGLVLEDNGGDDLAVPAGGLFTFATALALGASYVVTVKTQPSNPAQTCSVTNASGTVASANISSVSVSCTNNPTAATTAVGTALPVPPASKVIDATGGSISSADGRMTVTVPAGAVAAASSFTIQPITNQAPGGVGDAYRLGPAGETFSTPVSISVHYSSADLAGTVADLLSLAYQDAQGRWAINKSVTLDTANQAITVSSTHFSDWALIAGLSISPAAARIGTGATQALTLIECEQLDSGNPLIEYVAECGPAPGGASGWSANSVLGGNSAVGTVANTGEATATYTAPAQSPAANPVAVSTQALVQPLTKTTETLVSNITVGGCSAWTAKACTWTGTSSASNNHWKATAQVTWQWKENDPTDPNIAIYVPVSGSVILTDLQPGCYVDGTPQSIADNANSVPPSQLTINFNTNPPTAGGTGTNLKGWTESCTPPANPPPKVGAVWLVDPGVPLSADGLKIEGNADSYGVSSSWSFTAN